LSRRPHRPGGRLARFSHDTGAEADYIVVKLARRLIGQDWLPQFIKKANAGRIE
jgi:hypothetical protein